MEEKESPFKPEQSPKPRLSGFSGKLFSITKLLLGVCLLPFVYSVSVSFLEEFSLVDKASQRYFWSGVISLLILYLFVWEPVILYTKGQKLLEMVFTFFKPLVRVAPYLLPIYTLVLFIAYWVLAYVCKWPADYFVFFIGLSMSLHLILSAKTLRGKQGDFLKANYLFGFSFIYILNILLLAFFFSFIFEAFSFVHFCNRSYYAAAGILGAVVRQVFLSGR